MRFSIPNISLLPAVSSLCSIVERQQTLPSMNMILVEQVHSNILSLTATDNLMEMSWRISDVLLDELTPSLVPAQKLLEICRNSSQDAQITLESSTKNIKIRVGKRNYLLNTMPVDEFPKQKNEEETSSLCIGDGDFKYLLKKVSFAMAKNDARYYLNGALFSIAGDNITMVATDGHRLALCSLPQQIDVAADGQQVILPRKFVIELMRLLGDSDKEVRIKMNDRQICIDYENITIISQLVDGNYPDYQRVIPQAFAETVKLEHTMFRQTLEAACVIREERSQNVLLSFSNGKMLALTSNRDGEKAEVEQEIEYSGDEFRIAFNAQYLLDVLTVVESDRICFSFKDNNSGAQISEEGTDATINIIMPTRL